jgi:Fe-S cluster assembly protein SufD
MNDYKAVKQWYLENFRAYENQLNGSASGDLHSVRKDAIARFEELDFPTVKDEEWKYTNIAPLLKYNFKPGISGRSISGEDVKGFLFNNMDCHLLVFINGIFNEKLSDLSALPDGVVTGSLATYISKKHPAIEKYFGKYAGYREQIFTSLSTAFVKDGAFVYVPKNKVVEKPIHILFIASSGGEKQLIQPRNLYVAESGSQASVIEHFVTTDESIYFTNSVTEVVTGENAVLDHIKLQEESRSAFHIGRMEVDQERSSNFVSHSISFGGAITRNDFNARFNGEGGESTLNGLFMIEGEQLFDAHTLIDHAMPHCNSYEHYKGILDDKSKGVFNGKVMVRKDAQKTNAFQENNNIILSKEALVNTKPQLEIFADDVKCSHGATIGQLDADSMFYLKTRGIGEDKGRAILIHAFASEVVKSIRIENVKNYVEGILTKKFDNYE